MVTQRVAPIGRVGAGRGGDARRSSMSAAAVRGKLVTPVEQSISPSPEEAHAVEMAEVVAVHGDDEDDGVALGTAVNTRNYEALLNNLARQRRTSSGASSTKSGAASPGYNRQTLALGTVYQHAHPRSPAESEGVIVEGVAVESGYESGEAEDRTVVGLPVSTGNYEAIVAGAREVVAEPWTDRAVATTSAQPVDNNGVIAGATQSTEAGNNSESGGSEDGEEEAADEDAVMGLPISTGNYVAYLAGDNSSGLQHGGIHRHRGYSNLASDDGRGNNNRETRVSDPSLSSSRRRAVHHDSFPTAPTNGSDSPHQRGKRSQQRTSCFDNRRASNAAFVPHAGWVFIKGGTFKSWKRYYAVLSGLEFKYSKGVGQSPKGFGMLTGAHRDEDLESGLVFEFGDGNRLEVRCSNDHDVEQWLSVVEKALERNQNLNSQSKTSYTLTASEQHEGYLFKQDKSKAWKRCFFVVRIDGYLECRDREQGTSDRKSSGYIKSVSFADCHANGLAIQLSTDTSIVCYADSYDEQMLWYGAISSAVSANGKTPQPKTSIKSSYVHTALSNHAGWLYKHRGVLKGWKRFYFTLHGVELAFAKDTNSEVVLCDKAHSVEEWDGHVNGLQIRLKSGRMWKVYAESYESAKRWRSIISDACRRSETFSLKKYLNGRRRKRMSPVFGGWLTEVEKGKRLRQFYVMDGTSLGYANDVDNQLERLGSVVEVGSTRDLEWGMVFTFSDGRKLKVNCDSLAGSRCWYECLNFAIQGRSG